MFTHKLARSFSPWRFSFSGCVKRLAAAAAGGTLLLLLALAPFASPPAMAQSGAPPFRLAWSASYSANTQSVAWGDYDNDGDLDLAVGSSGQPVQLYRNHYRSLEIIWFSDDSRRTQEVAWADYDGDGDLDLAAGNYGEPNRLYRNNQGAMALTWSSPESDPTTGIAWGDYDGDGDFDLAVGNYGEVNRVYRNDAGALALAWSSLEADYTTTVAWGDYDSDGDLDLAVGNYGEPNRVYRNQGGTLGASFAWSSVEGHATESLAWGDYDGDGDLDLAEGNDGQPDRVYRNDEADLAPAWASEDADRTNSLAWGDYDNDGDLDLVTGNGVFPSGEPNRVYRNDAGSLTARAAWATLEADATYSVAWGDYDGDGDLDLMAGNGYHPSRLYRNDGASLTLDWSSPAAEETNSLAWGDVDGDGDPDLAAGNDGRPSRVYRNHAGVLVPHWSSLRSDRVTSLAWGDVDGDGDLDLAAGNFGGPNRLYRNEAGTLSGDAVWSSAEADDTKSLAWGDVDGDGDLDLAAGNAYQPNRLYRNDGGSLTVQPAWSAPEANNTYSLAWGDYDGDGDLDLAAGNWGQRNQLYRNERGTLTAGAVWYSVEADNTYSVAWADYDGDGDLDLAAGNDGHPNRLYRNENGSLLISAAWTSAEADNTTSLAWGDYDGDGDLDLAAGNWRQPNRLYVNDRGTLAPNATWSSPEADATFSVAWGDYDSDGDLDLAAGNTEQANRLYTNHRDARRGPAPIPLIHTLRPGISAGANSYSSAHIWHGPAISLTYDLFHLRGAPAQRIIGSYSLAGGGQWFQAAAANGTPTSNLDTSTLSSQTYRNDTPAAVPDLGSLTSGLTLAGRDAIADVDVFLNLAHTWGSDLVVRLASPFGRSALLIDRRGGSGDNFTNTVLDDEASASIDRGAPPFTGRYRPEEALSRFDGFPSKGEWTLSVRDEASGDSGTLLSWGLTVTLNGGAVHTYTWDLFESGVMGHSDNAVFRLEAIPAITHTPNSVPGPYLYASYASSAYPFRVRGSQVRVLSRTLPISNALVYRLPAGQATGGRPYTDLTGRPFRTDSQGYLQGRGEIRPGDRLLAMAPTPLPPVAAQRYGDRLHLYATNGAPTATGLDAFGVAQPGVQTVTVSADYPLLLFDLDVSLEWDAHNEPGYLEQLAFDLRQASRYLYDFTNGQAALGQVSVHQDGDGWLTSDVVIYATNRLRPLAIQGGVVVTPTTDPDHPDIVYDRGQIRMGATWNRYGDPVENERQDWQLALAHELAHYLLFQEDTYLGLNADNLLTPVGSCTGSAMGDVYKDHNTEFLDDAGWGAGCADTLANRILGRSEWTTIREWYPALHGTTAPHTPNPGPSGMPFDLTTVSLLGPITPTETLADPTFYVDYVGGAGSSSAARSFLLRQIPGGEYVLDLGSPFSGQNRVLARGARAGDRLCIFDQPRAQYGCKPIQSNDTYHLAMQADPDWAPLIRVSPVNTRTVQVAVEVDLPGAPSLQARLFPEYGFGSDPITLAYEDGVYRGTFPEFPYPPVIGHVQVWTTDPWRERMVPYTIGGNPGENPFSHGHGPFSHGHGPFSHGHGPFSHGHGAFVVSPDGQMSLFTPAPEFEEGDLYAIQGMAALPALPPGKVMIGQGYSLVSVGRPVSDASISFEYLGMDVLKEMVDEETLAIHFWDGAGWRALETAVSTYYNMASTQSQGDGVYALLAGGTVPHVEAVVPPSATNEVTRTLGIAGGYFLEPLQVRLAGSAASYILPLQSVTPLSITAVVSRGLPAGEYLVQVVNGDGAVSPVPVAFALYDPAPGACFYDFFESGAGKWQSSGDWAVAVLPGGGRAVTDSPSGNYDSAIPPAFTRTTAITSQAFSLDGCPDPVLSFRHDYVIARAGPSQDVGRVEISTDAGATWTELARYSGGGLFGVAPQDVESPEWTEVAWKDARIDLSGYSGTARLRFSLEVDRDVSDKGWLIDDVRVGPLAEADLQIALAREGAGDVVAGEPVTYTLLITNAGPDSVNAAVTHSFTADAVASVSSPPGCSGEGPVLCAFDNFTGTRTLTMRLATAPAFSGTLTNTAVITGAGAYLVDGDPANNRHTAQVTVTIKSGRSLFLPAILKQQ
jgi:subtilisin-like proprotein convertase family protein